MRRIWILAGLSALTIALSACGAKNDGTASVSPSLDPAAAANAQKLTITASNWKFDQAEYRVKKGQPVALTLKNAQGIHGLEVEKLGIKLDNKTSTKTFTPDKAGKYNIVCTIPCGNDHLKMRAVLIVEE